jgi:hypothetical protein
MKIAFIADFFADQVSGGGELNNEELILILRDKGHTIEKLRSHTVHSNLIEAYHSKGYKFVVANFINLSPESQLALRKTAYIIYEHDHKYVTTRNPALYRDFKVPAKYIINFDFYQNSLAVLCQSEFHSSIVKKNLGLENIVSVGGNLWSENTLDNLRLLSDRKKNNRCSIMQSDIPHKGTEHAKSYCRKNNLEFDLITPCGYSEFLSRLGSNNVFVFFPKTPETLSRVIVEARMMNMKVITNSLVGAAREPWFNKKGHQLIDIISQKREEIPEMVLEVLNGHSL